jgi:apolipoprotein N-acyltransferase
VAATGGAAGALAFPEPGWWWLAPLFLVPILLACRAAPAWGIAARHGWLAGSAFFFAAHHWAIPSVTVFVLPLSLLLGTLWAPVGALAWATLRPPLDGRRLAGALVLVPSAWVVAEVIRSWDRLGGPWVLLGASQWNNRVVLSLAALGGVWLVSFAVAALAVAITAAVSPGTAPRVRILASGAGIALVAAAGLFGTLRSTDPGPGDVRIAGVQPGVIPDPDQRFAVGEELTRSISGSDVDLVVWAESSIGFDPERRPDYVDRVTALSADLDSPVLVNLDRRPGPGGVFKTSVLVDENGVAGSYDKTRLVPFGEYIPMRRFLGWVGGLTNAAEVDRRPGDALAVVVAPDAGPDATDLRIGPLICFESAFPDLGRAHAASGVDLLVLQTATTTVEGTWAQAQHASLAAVRAVESGRPVVHAALSGVSAAFAPDGRRLAWFEGDGTYSTVVPLSQGTTPFVRFGNWVPVGSMLAIAFAAAVAGWRARRRPIG